jgi:hypothetical protein
MIANDKSESEVIISDNVAKTAGQRKKSGKCSIAIDFSKRANQKVE